MDLETFFTASTQLEVFLVSCGVGVVLGLVYDVLRVFRIVLPHSDLLTHLEDAVLVSSYGVFLMCFAFSLMRGQLRAFFVVGNALGFTLWFCTAGVVVVGVANRVKGYVLCCARWVAYPAKRLWGLAVALKKKLRNPQKTLD